MTVAAGAKSLADRGTVRGDAKGLLEKLKGDPVVGLVLNAVGHVQQFWSRIGGKHGGFFS